MTDIIYFSILETNIKHRGPTKVTFYDLQLNESIQRNTEIFKHYLQWANEG